ncbi:hypothetical protein OHD62_19530 [Mesorhizobium sp. YC-39]|uniref:hypothetical protein n=1 Tax=unclassified Mesorhizobium TaxID=325217 RepID=UPI0021E80D79|nr:MULTISPECIES: hypothetical protein [unclassified Mesorhizobium]MCV3210036.1 hypothetical protein [Mesorhizobium sp. YC-2]MCV3230566.1 hypothetical protein [Mesorhizobium sp. YC-39]
METDSSHSPSPDVRPARERSPDEHRAGFIQQLRVSRAYGHPVPFEVASLFPAPSAPLHSDDVAALAQFDAIVDELELQSRIAPGSGNGDDKTATAAVNGFATADTSRRPEEHQPPQGVSGNDPKACPVAPISAPLIRASSLKNRNSDRSRLSSRLNPRRTTWERLSAEDRFVATIEAAGRRQGIALTLNLSKEREITLRASKDPARLLSTYINRELGKAGLAAAYSIRFEISPAGRLHVHGAVVDSSYDPSSLNELKRALVAAAGKIHGKAGSRQCVFRELYYPAGWHAYLRKTRRKICHELGIDKITFISRGMREIARADFHERSRQAGPDRRRQADKPAQCP